MPYYYNVVTRQSQWEPPSGEAVMVHEQTLQNEDDEEVIRACHLLIKHSESRRPSSWKQVNEFYVMEGTNH